MIKRLSKPTFIHSEQEIQLSKQWRTRRSTHPIYKIEVIEKEKIKSHFVARVIGGFVAILFTLGIALGSAKVCALFSKVEDTRTYVLLEPGILAKLLNCSKQHFSYREYDEREKEKNSLLQKALDQGAAAHEPNILIDLLRHNSDILLFKQAMDQGANVEARSPEGYSVMHWATNKVQYDPCYLELLLDHPKIDMAKADSAGNTYLHYFAYWGKNALEIALKKFPHLDVNAEDNKGNTPLHWAIEKEDFEIIQLLTEAKADLNRPNKLGYTPMHYAALAINRGIFIYLLKRGGTATAPQSVDQKTPEQLLAYYQAPPPKSPLSQSIKVVNATKNCCIV